MRWKNIRSGKAFVVKPLRLIVGMEFNKSLDSFVESFCSFQTFLVGIHVEKGLDLKKVHWVICKHFDNPDLWRKRTWESGAANTIILALTLASIYFSTRLCSWPPLHYNYHRPNGGHQSLTCTYLQKNSWVDKDNQIKYKHYPVLHINGEQVEKVLQCQQLYQEGLKLLEDIEMQLIPTETAASQKVDLCTPAAVTPEPPPRVGFVNIAHTLSLPSKPLTKQSYNYEIITHHSTILLFLKHSCFHFNMYIISLLCIYKRLLLSDALMLLFGKDYWVTNTDMFYKQSQLLTWMTEIRKHIFVIVYVFELNPFGGGIHWSTATLPLFHLSSPGRS